MRALLLPLMLLGGCATPPPSFDGREVVAMWVTRWDYHNAGEVREIISNCASAGVTDVLWQCRGEADAYYRSEREPVVPFDGDPLELAAREAHARGLRIHAWLNAMPLWRGKEPPAAGSIAGRHPDWVVVGKDGKPQAPNDHYLCANPAVDAWVEHFAAVARDVAAYDIDGIHLDYIRYFEGDWSYDAETLRRFPAGGDWTAFKSDLVTAVVRKVREATRGKLLTAAVYPTAPRRRGVCQDAERWVREGLVDGVFPMQYREQNQEFEAMVKDSRDCFGAKAFNGIGVTRHPTAERTAEQIAIVRASGAKGFALFSYDSFFRAELGPARVKMLREMVHAIR